MLILEFDAARKGLLRVFVDVFEDCHASVGPGVEVGADDIGRKVAGRNAIEQKTANLIHHCLKRHEASPSLLFRIDRQFWAAAAEASALSTEIKCAGRIRCALR